MDAARKLIIAPRVKNVQSSQAFYIVRGCSGNSGHLTNTVNVSLSNRLIVKRLCC